MTYKSPYTPLMDLLPQIADALGGDMAAALENLRLAAADGELTVYWGPMVPEVEVAKSSWQIGVVMPAQKPPAPAAPPALRVERRIFDFEQMRVRQADVDAIWPVAKKAPKRPAGERARSGPLPVERERIMSEMLNFIRQGGDLKGLKDVEGMNRFRTNAKATYREAKAAALSKTENLDRN